MDSISSSPGHNASGKCPLFGLPPELRLMIYNELFSACTFRAEYMNGHWIKTKRHVHDDYSTADCVALLASCKTIYREAKSAFEASVHFRLTWTEQTWAGHRRALESDHMQRLVDMPEAILHARKVHFRLRDCKADSIGVSATTVLPVKRAMKHACNTETVHVSIAMNPNCWIGFDHSMLSLFWGCDEIREHKAVTADIIEWPDSSSLAPAFNFLFYHKLLRVIGA